MGSDLYQFGGGFRGIDEAVGYDETDTERVGKRDRSILLMAIQL